MRSALSQWTDSKVRPGGEKVAYGQNREGSEGRQHANHAAGGDGASTPKYRANFARTYGVIHFTGTPTAGRALRACVRTLIGAVCGPQTQLRS